MPIYRCYCILGLSPTVGKYISGLSYLIVNLKPRPQCHTPNMFGTVDIGIISPAFQKLKSFFKNIFIGLKHLELRKIADVIPCTGYYKFKKDSDANYMTVQQYYHETYNIHIK